MENIIDKSFNTGAGFDGVVNSIQIQNDQKIVIGGKFNSYNGNPANKIIRLNQDGSIDSSFDTGLGINGYSVYDIALQTDGKIIIGGDFLYYNGKSCKDIIRVNSDGSVDNSFYSDKGTSGSVYGGIYTMAIQKDGKVVVGGGFDKFNGVFKNLITRLNINGRLDNSFKIGTGFYHNSNSVRDIIILNSQNILVGGDFSRYKDSKCLYLASLKPNGDLDTLFETELGGLQGVKTIIRQLDNKIVVGGVLDFKHDNDKRSYVIRLNPDGSFDYSFEYCEWYDVNYIVSVLSLQSDGKILVGGYFSLFKGEEYNNFARLNADGTLDKKFSIGNGFDDIVSAIAIQADGKIVVGGNFNSFNNNSANKIVRLNNTNY